MSEAQTLPQKLLRVQRSIGVLTKDSDNPFFKSKYADLNQVLEVAKKALHAENLFLVQGPGLNESGKYIETSIIDADTGQQLMCRVPFSGNEKNMQEIGAATTYGRRFGIVSLLAMEQDDDDGETAVGRGSRPNNEVNSRSNSQGSAKPSVGAGATTSVATASSGAAIKANPKEGAPVQAKVSSSTAPKTTLEQISLTSKAIIDSKRDTLENLTSLVTAFGVKSKEELNEEQAAKLLKQLKEKLNAK